MKILAIRGENIASLAQKFALEFDGDLLKRQGLIAISGKTGSGKSSLLDAMCLALYEQVPRFSSAQRSVEVGSENEQQKLKANDVRHLVSRGKSEAWVEVELLSNDQRRYLVRWQARRARGHVNGRWQGSTRELIDVSDQQVFSENKREFQQRIDTLVGLDYEQFRRAVVLAQGDFAAFLQAAEDQRSALLERMTGTQLYSNISQQVYQNAREQQQRVSSLQEQMGRISYLSDEERLQLVSDLAELQKSLDRFVLASNDQQTLLQIEQQQRSNALEKDGLAQQKAQLEAAQQDIDKVRHSLQQLRMLEPHRPLHQSLSRLAQELSSLALQISEQGQILDQHEQQHLLAKSQVELNQTQLEQLLTQQHLREPEIERALRLDHELNANHSACEDLEKQQVALSDNIVVVKHTHHRALQQCESELEQLNDAKQWLSEHQQLHSLQHQNSAIERNLQVYLDQQEQQKKRIDLKEQHQQQMLESKHEVEQIQNQIQQIQAQDQELAQQLLNVSHEKSEDVLAKYQLVNAQSEQQAILCRYLEQARALSEQLEHAQHRYKQLQGQQQTTQEQQQYLGQQVAKLTIESEEAKRAFQSARAVVSLDDLRKELVDGESCPLCGSLDHPFVEHTPEVSAIFHQLEQRHQQLEQQLRSNELELAKLNAQAQQLDQQLSDSETLVKELDQQLASLVHQAQTLGFSWPQSLDQLLTYQHQQQQSALELASLLQSLNQQLDDYQAQHAKREQLQARYNESQQHLQKLNHQRLNYEHQFENHSNQRAQIEKQSLEAQANIQHQYQQLVLLLGDLPWEQWLAQHGPRRCALQIVNLVDQYQQVFERQVQHNERYISSQKQIALEEQNLEKLGQELQHYQQQLSSLLLQNQHLSQERRGLLDGLTVIQWRELANANVQKSRQAADTSQQQMQSLTKQMLVAQTNIEQLSQQQQQRKLDYKFAQEQWRQVAQNLELDDAQIEQLLSLDPKLRGQWESDSQAHQQQLAINASQSHELSQRVKRIDKQWINADSQLKGHLQQLKLESIEALEHQRLELQEQAYQKRSLIEQDQRSQAQSGELHKELSVQIQRLELLENLNVLIGSASGAKFRVFAQQLTLENLLFEANAQLRSLAPRYQLQRVPDAALALQVIDRDMGDEVRSISSLSGGETFLVSLALALALASVSADNIEIRSLFIDEGFGTLDPESLDMVLACLDNLQASGRQVTVISHVQAMVERIPARVILQPLGAGRSELKLEIA
ncbi:hypothetical protein DBZ36_13515 [Alginatibacterium sediminis]|uniref:Rad50/SbcC-type AAA domain-containing protein n=1 Tax=Alginatibacterium sediminis TaxID=2164068 RepID=A0A420E9W7_9ALTE|nr:AAA family ATPase [Alginatibacterium sediminis]RKF17461.1 hypothetical protein DBZ36_13515 [Alginatibacterium sediminis]